jgi:hypothetical protein
MRSTMRTRLKAYILALHAALAVVLACSVALAQGGMFLGGCGGASCGGGGAAAWVPNATAIVNNEGFGSTTSTFNLTLTSASTDTVIVFVSQSTRALTGVTIGGNAMTQAVSSGGTDGVSIWYIVGAYTNPTVVVSAAAAFSFVGCSYGKWTGASAVPSATTASIGFGFRADPSVLSSLTVPSGGVLLAIAGAATGVGITWDNITKDTETANSTNWVHSSAHYSTAGAIAVSQSGSNFAGNADAAITIGP